MTKVFSTQGKNSPQVQSRAGRINNLQGNLINQRPILSLLAVEYDKYNVITQGGLRRFKKFICCSLQQ